MTKATGPVSAVCCRSMPTAQQIRVSDWTRRDHRQAVKISSKQMRWDSSAGRGDARWSWASEQVVHAGEGMTS